MLRFSEIENDSQASSPPRELSPRAIRETPQETHRLYPESDHLYRGPFQRDRDRIVHTAAFRRLAYKTQVFTGRWGDYHRTRLTHTLEVVGIARCMARALGMNEDLTETLALMHDIGHPPCGHAGEDALHECVSEIGGFNHNVQALRIVERIEQPYPDFPGLNLCHATLEGQRWRAAKRSSPVTPSLEAQIVDAADSIAYNAADMDDAVELGVLQVEDLSHLELWRIGKEIVANKHAALEGKKLRSAVVRAILNYLATNIYEESKRQLSTGNSSPKIGMPDEVERNKRQLESFLLERVYRRKNIVRLRERAKSRIRALFHHLMKRPALLPSSYQARLNSEPPARVVADYVAGMTDRYMAQRAAKLGF